MARLAKLPVALPSDVSATLEAGVLSLNGPQGALSRAFKEHITLSVSDGTVTLAPAGNEEGKQVRALWGTYAAHVRNMVHGVSVGFKKELQIEGVGYRASVEGSALTLTVGFSHPVVLHAPEGVGVTVEKNTIVVSGPDKEAVGQFAANVRAVRPPEPYKGKGIRYAGEYIIRKQGKKAV